jgi:hypothetical protein
MTSKGVLPSDRCRAKQRALKDARNFNKGELAAAMDAIEQVTGGGQRHRHRRPVRRREDQPAWAPCSARAANAKAKEEVTRLLGEVTRAYSDGRYAEATEG